MRISIKAAIVLVSLLVPSIAGAQAWQMRVHSHGTVSKFLQSDIDSVTFVLADTTRPAPAIISAVPAGPTSITLNWTAVGDDGNVGTAASYELRVSTSGGMPFDSMTVVPGLPFPSAAGTPEQFTVGSLFHGQNYCFRLKVTDESGNSSISNEACATTAGQPQLVIAEVYGGAGATGSTYTQDYVVLFNQTTVAISLTGWSLQFTNATGTTWNNQPFTAGTSVAAHGYYLIAVGPTTTGLPLPTPDFSVGGNINTTAGKVALMATQSGIGGNTCPPVAITVDFVGYGNQADCAEGTAAPNLSATTSAIRLSQGCQDSNDNFADFFAGSPTPRNSSTSLHVCP